jgi:lipid-binding SYLF domain-containing protein
MQRLAACLSLVLAFLIAAAPARADERTDQRLQHSLEVFESFTGFSEQAIPDWLLERAYGIVVAPKVFEMALVGGGRGGKGVMAVRNPDGTWSDPVFLTLYGGSFGFQFGMQMTDVVIVLMSRKTVEGISGGKFILGADASVAAGPVGRTGSANTDLMLKAQVLSYSRSEGLFAGVALEGTVLSVDDDADASAYGVAGILPSQIFAGTAGTPPAAAVDFKAALTRATERSGAAPPAATGEAAPTQDVTATPTAPASDAAGAAAAPAPAQPAQTYPMEDQSPGAPPPP